MDYVAKLREVRELFSRPGSWTQGAYARRPDGEDCLPTTPDATCFCITGGVRRIVPDGGYSHAIERMLLNTKGIDDGLSLFAWNDKGGRTRADVLALIDQTIANCEARQAINGTIGKYER